MDFSNNFKEVIIQAKLRSKNGLIEPNHLLAGVILTEESVGYKMLTQLIDIDDAKLKVEELYKIEDNEDTENGEDTENDKKKKKASMSVLSEQIMLQTQLEAKRSDSFLVRTEHLILTYVKSTLIDGVTYEHAKNILNEIYDNNSNSQKNNNMGKTTTKQKSTTPLLDEFSTDYTNLALLGKLDSIVGREDELKRIAQVLSRRKKNNPVLIGLPGVGKTAIVEGLAINIVNRTVPETLYNKRLLALEMGNIVAGTKYRGEFEERMKKIVDELKASDNIIIYIDEIHTLVGAGSTSGTLDAANILKPALSRGEISCIGSTTLDEYRKIEKDGALERRFQKVMIDEPTYDETRLILYKLKEKYEEYHNVEYTQEAIESCLKLSDRYITDRAFPDKAIDALDESGASVRVNDLIPQEILDLEKELRLVIETKDKSVKDSDYENAGLIYKKQKGIESEIDNFYLNRKKSLIKRKVTSEDVATVVSIMTGIPSKNISEDDTSKLLGLEKELKRIVVGQDEAVEKIVKSVLRNKAGLSDSNRPIGTFMFMGPTGVGKTYLAKKLAEQLFTSEKDMIRIDMSEYMEKHTVSRLIGAPPGYIGHDESGQLTEAVRRKPYSIILLDEIEKAHPDVSNILLQIFEDGILTDSQGKTVNFKNTVIIMTSNVGSRESKMRGNGIGFDSNKGLSKSIVEKALKSKFPPEFLNRIDEIINFESLGKEEIKGIIDLELDKFIKRLNENGLDIELDDSSKEFLFEKGWDEDLGARPLKRAIQRYIEDEVSLKLITGVVKRGNKIYVTKTEGEEGLSFTSSTNLLDKLNVEVIKIEK